MSTVSIRNVQAIDFITFDMPEDQGGVRLFRGESGSGKTTAIACLNALLGQKVSLSPSDDAPKGEIEGLGVKKTIGKTIRGQGDPEVANLEGRFDFSDLVDPPVKAAEARNKSRIRALVGLTASECSVADFYDLFGGQEQFEQTIIDEDGELEGITDVLELADRIKRKLQALARLRETQLEGAEMRWQNAVEMAKGHKPDAPPESVAGLAAKYTEAKNAHEQAKRVIESNATAIAQNKRVAELLAKHDERKPERDPEAIIGQLKSCKETVADLEKRLEVAKASVAKLQEKFDEAVRWEEQKIEIEASQMEVLDKLPDPEPYAAEEAAALAALEGAEEAKQRYEAAVKAKQFSDEIKAKQAEAEKYRTLATRTNEVVTAKLPAGPLQVRDGILCAYSDKRDKWISFDELSEGQRWSAALQIAIEAVGEGGVLPVRQEAYQALDPKTRKAVAAQLAEAKVWVVSGEVTDGPLRVE